MKKLILSTLVAVGLIGSAGAQTQLTGSLTNGLVAQWLLNGNANDSLGLSDGMTDQVVWTNTQNAMGINQKMALFNGNSVINVSPTTNFYSLTNKWTISAWIKPTTTGNTSPNSIIYVLSGTYQMGFGTTILNSEYFSGYWNIKWVESDLPNPRVNAGALFYPNNWYLLTQSFDGTNVLAYINGVKLNQIQINKGSGTDQFSSTLKIGYPIPNNAYPYNNEFAGGFQGLMHSVRIYNRPLSSNEIANFYLQESTPPLTTNGFGYSTNSNSAMILYYRGSNSNVTIPSTINGLPVTSIWDYAFAGHTNISSITIPDSITSFGENVFSDSPNFVINGSPSMVSYLYSNSAVLGFTGYSLTSLQNMGVGNWILSDRNFLSSLSTLLGIQPIQVSISNFSNSLSGISNSLSTTFSNQTVGLSNSLSTSISNQTVGLSNTVNALSNNLSATIASLSSNPNFVASLATNPVFLNALAAQIVASSNNLGIAAKLPQTLTLPAIAPITYSSKKVATVALKAVSSGNLTNTTYSILNPSVGIVNNAKLIVLGKGTTTVTATNSGNGIYLPASTSQTLIVK